MNNLPKDINISFANNNYVSYVFEDNNLFNEVAFNILQNVDFELFCHIVKSQQNGQIKLSYVSEESFVVNSYVSTIDKNDLAFILNGYVKALTFIEKNSLLNNCGIMLQKNSIFYSSSNGTLGFICLPLNQNSNLNIDAVVFSIISFCNELMTCNNTLKPHLVAIINFLQQNAKNVLGLHKFLESNDYLEATNVDIDYSLGNGLIQVPAGDQTQEPEFQVESVKTQTQNNFAQMSNDISQLDNSANQIQDNVQEKQVVSNLASENIEFATQHFNLDDINKSNVSSVQNASSSQDSVNVQNANADVAQVNLTNQVVQDSSSVYSAQVNQNEQKVPIDLNVQVNQGVKDVASGFNNQENQTVEDAPSSSNNQIHQNNTSGTSNADGPVFLIQGVGDYEYLSTNVGSKPIVLGRSKKTADFVIDNQPKISRNHCSIFAQNNGVMVRDLGSANGTYVDGTKISSDIDVLVSSGSSFTVCGITFMVTRVK